MPRQVRITVTMLKADRSVELPMSIVVEVPAYCTSAMVPTQFIARETRRNPVIAAMRTSGWQIDTLQAATVRN